MKERGIIYRTVTPLWPQANGEAKSFMKPLNKAIKAARLEGLNWKEEIYNFLLSYRTTPHCSTGVAPTQLLFNREVRNNIPLPKKEEINYYDLHKKAKENMERKQQKAKVYTDTKRRARNSEISIGSNVIVKQERRNKLTSRFDPKPLTVTKVNGTMVTAERKVTQSLEMCPISRTISSKQRNASQRNDTGI